MRKFDLSEDEKRKLEKRKTLDALVMPEDINIYDLLVFVYTKNINRDLNKLMMDSLKDVSLDYGKVTDEMFKDICDLISCEFEKICDSDYRVKDYLYEALLLKILIVVRSFYTDLSQKEILKLASETFSLKYKLNNLKLLFRILCNDKILGNKEKRNILIKSVLYDDNAVVASDLSDYNKYFNFITSDKIMECDNKTFNKIAKLSVINDLVKILDELFKTEKINDKKRELILDYYLDLVDYLCDKQVFDNAYLADKICASSVFRVVFSDRLLQMDDNKFKENLSNILKKKNPNAYAEILGSDLDDKKRMIVFPYVSEDAKSRQYYRIDTDENMCDFAKTASSENMKQMDDDAYGAILSFMSSKSENLRKAQRVISGLINIKEVFDNRTSLLLFAVAVCMSECDSLGLDEMYYFYSDKNMNIYDDDEIISITNIILNGHNKSERMKIVELFLSDRVLEMTKDKRKQLIDDYEHLEENKEKKRIKVIPKK